MKIKKKYKKIFVIILILIGVLFIITNINSASKSIIPRTLSIVGDEYCEITSEDCPSGYNAICNEENGEYYITCKKADCNSNPSYSLDCELWCDNGGVFQYNTNRCCNSPNIHQRADGLCYSLPDTTTDNWYTRVEISRGCSPIGWNTNVCEGKCDCAIDGDWDTFSANQPTESAYVEKCFQVNTADRLILKVKLSNYGEQSPTKVYIKSIGNYEEVSVLRYGESNIVLDSKYEGNICVKIELNPSTKGFATFLYDFIIFPENKIVIYRLGLNCEENIIFPSERTNNDYDNLKLCEYALPCPIEKVKCLIGDMYQCLDKCEEKKLDYSIYIIIAILILLIGGLYYLYVKTKK